MGMVTVRRRPSGALPGSIALCGSWFLALNCAAQDWVFQPNGKMVERYSDNLYLAPAASAENGWFTELSAGLLLHRVGPRVSLSIDYRRSRLLYAGDSQNNRNQNFLSATGKIAIIENWLDLDTQAGINQRNQSAFGISTTPDSIGRGSNSVESRYWRLSPAVRGYVGEQIQYLLRSDISGSQSADPLLPSSQQQKHIVTVSTPIRNGGFSWSLTGQQSRLESDIFGSRGNQNLTGGVTYVFSGQLITQLTAGQDTSEIETGNKTTTRVVGGGLQWNPSDRTKIVATAARRHFGNEVAFAADYRTPMSAWKLGMNRDLGLLNDQSSASSPTTATGLLSSMLALSIPDATARASAIRSRFEGVGVGAPTIASGGSLTFRPTITTKMEASGALLGVRNSVTFDVSVRTQRAAEENLRVGTPFSPEDVRQRGASVAWAYRLTPTGTISFLSAYLSTNGLTDPSKRSKQFQHAAKFLQKLGPHTTFALLVRHATLTGAITNANTENSVAGTFEVRY